MASTRRRTRRTAEPATPKPPPAPPSPPPAPPAPPEKDETPELSGDFHRWRNTTARLVSFTCNDGIVASVRPGQIVSLAPEDTETALRHGFTALGPTLP